MVVSGVSGNYGYIIEDGSARHYIWIVDYLPYRFKISDVWDNGESDCEATILSVAGSAEPIHYFTVNGQQKVLSRDIKVAYDTQQWNEELKEYSTVETSVLIESFTDRIRITPPAYCYTSFHVSGDRFMQAWNWEQQAESPVVAPVAVQVTTEAVQLDADYSDLSRSATKKSKRASRVDDGDIDSDSDSDSNGADSAPGSNQIKGDESSLGGSAPSEIEFRAYVTEGVMHHEWQMSKDPEFEELEYRFNEQNLDYTFMEEGTYYIRYVGSNSDGSCEAVGDTYTVAIGASELLCPNAFSPDGDGVNDEWKVSYRSIVDFECWIFDRYGAQIHHFSDPNLGWDGTRGGRAVKPGVYYYVITAEGADGKKYKKSGDINILRHNRVDNAVDEE